MEKSVFVLFCATSLNVLAQVDRCTPQQKSEMSATYDQFRSVSRAGDLEQVKALSSRSVRVEIAKFEREAQNPSTLAHQMGFVMPALSEAKNIRCEYSGQRARFMVQTETVDRESARTILVTTIVMFERTPGTKWLVGEKAMTNPFSPQSTESLLQHEKLRLP